jgi:zinc transport system substrate-binding protein
MKITKKIAVLLLAIVLLLLLFTIHVVKNFPLSVSNKDKVAATIFPLHDITRNIAGSAVGVELILPAGSSPHTFDLTPKQASNLSGSRAVFAIGHGLDSWASKLVATADVEKIVVVDKGIEFLASSDTDEPGDDPHYWLSTGNAKIIAGEVRDELVVLFPEKADIFEENYLLYMGKLDALDAEIRASLSKLPNRNIAAFHNAWSYYAKEYGIRVVASFEEFPGKEPTPQYLAEFQDIVKQKGVKVLFSEPQFSTRSLEPIANDLGVSFSVLDPLGGVDGRESFEELMRYNTTQIVNALR